MTSYYLTVEKVGKGPVGVSAKAMLTWSHLPNYAYFFARKEDADKLQPGDKLVDYVAPSEFGFSAVMEVERWDNGVVSVYNGHLYPGYPYLVKIRTLCDIRDKGRMPKWRGLRHDLHFGPSSWALHTTLRKIDEHDYKLLKEKICEVAKRTTAKHSI